jgi:hypothetical protein
MFHSIDILNSAACSGGVALRGFAFVAKIGYIVMLRIIPIPDARVMPGCSTSPLIVSLIRPHGLIMVMPLKTGMAVSESGWLLSPTVLIVALIGAGL